MVNSPGNRAHELPDQVLFWLSELNEMGESPNNYFSEEFEEFSSIIPESELQNYCFQLKHDLKAAFESFSKWMECWIHLPLSVCRLGGENVLERLLRKFLITLSRL